MNHHRRSWILTFVLLLKFQRIEQTFAQPGIGHRFLVLNRQEYQVGQQRQNSTITTDDGHHDDNENSDNKGEQLKMIPVEDSNGTTVATGEFFRIFHKLGTSWTTILGMMRGIVNSAGGKTLKHDVYATSLREGKDWLLEQENWGEVLQPYTSLYQDLDKTFEDVLDSFLHWAASDEAPDGYCRLEGGVNGKESKINVSKALRRLEKYATWMADMKDDLRDLKATSIKDTFSIFDMKMSIDDCRRLVWWLDLAAVDWDRFESATPREIAQIYVWVSHYMLLHPNAQDQGLVLINSLNQIGFWPFMTMLPVDLGMKLNEFVISVIPIKTKFVVLMERPPWAKFAYQMLKPFMKGSMRRRVIVIEEGLYPTDYMYKVVGTNAIPNGIGNYAGKDRVEILQPYFEGKINRGWFCAA